MPPTMRAVDIRDGTGPADSLFINDSTPKPVPEGTQALIKVKAFGLNRMGQSTTCPFPCQLYGADNVYPRTEH